VALFFAPSVLPPSELPLHVRDIATLAVTATGLVGLHLHLKQRELDVLEEDRSLKRDAMTSSMGNRAGSSKHATLESSGSDPLEAAPLNESSTWEAATNINPYDPEADKPNAQRR